MSSLINGPPSLPNEIWMQILRIAIRTSEWHMKTFFPPPDDFALIEGFQNASLAFGALVKEAKRTTRDRSLSVDEVEEDFPAELVRHLEIRHKVSRPIIEDLIMIADRLIMLESLAIFFDDSSLLVELQASPIARGLRRLDLTYNLNGFTLLDIDLEFPNLVELRVSYNVCPRVSMRNAERCFVEFLFPDLDHEMILSAFISKMQERLAKLQRLRLLSIHLILTSVRELSLSSHEHIHHDRRSFSYRSCRQCFREFGGATLSREVRASKELAEALPKLECVRWLQAWGDLEYFDEYSQAQYKIVRLDGGEIRADRDESFAAQLTYPSTLHGSREGCQL